LSVARSSAYALRAPGLHTTPHANKITNQGRTRNQLYDDNDDVLSDGEGGGMHMVPPVTMQPSPSLSRVPVARAAAAAATVYRVENPDALDGMLIVFDTYIRTYKHVPSLVGVVAAARSGNVAGHSGHRKERSAASAAAAAAFIAQANADAARAEQNTLHARAHAQADADCKERALVHARKNAAAAAAPEKTAEYAAALAHEARQHALGLDDVRPFLDHMDAEFTRIIADSSLYNDNVVQHIMDVYDTDKVKAYLELHPDAAGRASGLVYDMFNPSTRADSAQAQA
jgi:hypothetical protein